MTRSDLTYRRRQALTPKLALGVILGSESIFFGTLLAAYLYMRADQPNWPTPEFSLARLLVPGGNTLLILFSALAAYLGLRAVRRGSLGALKGWLWATLLMGAVFVAGQVFEFQRSGMRPSDQAFGGVFFTLMGFHALHIIAGIVVLLALLVRAGLGDFSARRHVAVEIGVWFWYFVVAVWAVLFSALYLL